MSKFPIAIVSFEELDEIPYNRASLSRALAALGHPTVFVGPPRPATPGELLRVGAARGRWAPEPETGRADGVLYLRPLDLPARRIGTMAGWDRASLTTALESLGDDGWVVMFPRAASKPLPRPEGWRTCLFLHDEFLEADGVEATRVEPVLGCCDLLVCVSETIAAPRRDRVPRCVVLPNGYDDRLFPPDASAPLPDPEVAALPGPRIGYAGGIAPSKVDADLVARLAAARADWSFVLAGPTSSDEVTQALREHANVHVLDARPLAEVPRLLAALDVCLLPHVDNRVNRACSSLKVREALALGLPVVSTPVDELQAHPGAVFVGGDDDELLSLLDRAVTGESQADPEAVRWFTDGTWDVRARELVAAMEGERE